MEGNQRVSTTTGMLLDRAWSDLVFICLIRASDPLWSKKTFKKKNKNAEVSISTTLNFHNIETMKLYPVDDLWILMVIFIPSPHIHVTFMSWEFQPGPLLGIDEAAKDALLVDEGAQLGADLAACS